ncbi:hypothetical protein CK203_046076 [Vitis vinifera]|uniref:Retrotransposon gag domain-containing protein n=1 Tax=Vitis vinifera TaxID=29760 RepID=A0A438HP55_VITVI|nr:hypothetical protein CK203_046076 [Vitis vinifera]
MAPLSGMVNSCMLHWEQNSKGRLERTNSSTQVSNLGIATNIMEPQGEDQQSQYDLNEENFHLYRSMRDHMHPPRMSASSCIVPPSEQMIIRPYLVPLLPQFHGMENENPYTHIKDFEEERYMEAFNACSHHGFDTWMLVSFFYEGMSPTMKQLLETMCGGDFMNKSLDEALDFLNYVAEISRSWDEPHGKNSSKAKPQNNSKRGMYTLNEDVDVQAKMTTLSRRLEELEARGAHEIKVVNDVPMKIVQCSICQSSEHLVSECPTIPVVKEMFMEQANAVGFVKHSNSFPFLNTFNLGWRNHPNLSWKSEQRQFSSNMQTSQPQASPVEQAIVNLSKVMGDFIGDQKKKGKFPSQPQQNPRGVHEIGEKKNENSVKVDEVKAIITLRGDDRSKQDEIVNEKVKKKDKLLSPPFPKALQSRKVINNATKIFEVLKQVKVNIPLLDMIKQVPPYAKFLKDLCTMKRGLNINKKVFLTEQVSAIIQCKTPIKYKDPGCHTISVNIGDTYVEKALLDLSASVNLLPYLMYKQLGLRKLKPTSITLSLADRSIKIPRGMIEDILIQVDEFYYPVDFIILDTEPIARGPNHVSIILVGVSADSCPAGAPCLRE